MNKKEQARWDRKQEKLSETPVITLKYPKKKKKITTSTWYVWNTPTKGV